MSLLSLHTEVIQADKPIFYHLHKEYNQLVVNGVFRFNGEELWNPNRHVGMNGGGSCG
jgi:hypothetical protein